MSDSQPAETKIIYYNGDDDVPVLIRLAVPPDQVTLRDFKSAINIQSSCEHKFFFKTIDENVGIVKELITDDDAKLPFFKDNIICYVESQLHDDTACMCDVGQSRFLPNQHLHSHSHLHPHPHPHSHPPHYHHQYDYYPDDDTSSRISTSTNETSVSRYNPLSVMRRKRAMSVASSVSSVTDSSASCFPGQAIKTVTLNLDGKNFLGMSLVGQASSSENGGIYVGSIMKGGAVAAEGTIQPNDMILQVNDHVLSNMTNDQAVEILREAVQKPGPIKLVVAKILEPNLDNYFTILREEPIQPLNLEAWIQTTEAATGLNEAIDHPSSGSVSHSSMPISERHHLLSEMPELSLTNSTMFTIAKVAARPDSGLIIKDRKWLKIRIANAFVGRDLVDWLYKKVRGFSSKKEAYKYAKQMLKSGYIKITVAKKFSKNCYYVFDESVFCEDD
uniref:PDZ domain-containing protein n=2 Tax=Tetranychus urticae TaxID=32264 RepID=T1KCS7_TETUR